jgi:hypothetical protein
MGLIPGFWCSSARLFHLFQDDSPTLDSSSQSKSEHDGKQAAHAPHPALRSSNAEREFVPSAGDAERPMAVARESMLRVLGQLLHPIAQLRRVNVQVLRRFAHRTRLDP